MENKKTRYDWIDVLKAFSIFFIIFSHLGSNPLSVYFFTFMVNVFFFASGLTVGYSKTKTLKQFVQHRFKRLMVPYFAFSVLAMVTVTVFDGNVSIKDMAVQMLYGCRTNTFAVTLWFLPCLFVMGIFYHILSQYVKDKRVRFALCAVASFAFRMVSDGNILPWGIDNAVRFGVYYAAGDLLAGFLNGVAAHPKGLLSRKWLVAVVAVTALVAYFQYGHGTAFILDRFGLGQLRIAVVLTGAAFCFSNIALWSLVSIALQNLKPFAKLGTASLAICCLEVPVNRVVLSAVNLVGIQLDLGGNGTVLVLAAVLVFAAYRAAQMIQQYLPVLLGADEK